MVSKMHKILVISMLENYKPIYQKQDREKQYMLVFLASYGDCFSRRCRGGHIVSGCFLDKISKDWISFD